jgi:hypothetical protein
MLAAAGSPAPKNRTLLNGHHQVALATGSVASIVLPRYWDTSDVNPASYNNATKPLRVRIARGVVLPPLVRFPGRGPGIDGAAAGLMRTEWRCA